MAKNKNATVSKTKMPAKTKEGNGKARSGKMDFVRELVTRKQNKLTKAQAVELFRKQYPDVSEQTSKNTVSWTTMDCKRKSLVVTLLPRERAAQPAPKSKPAGKSKPAAKAPVKRKAPLPKAAPVESQPETVPVPAE